MGAGGLALDLLELLWSWMKKNKLYSVLLRLFSGYLRKEFLTLWLQRSDQV